MNLRRLAGWRAELVCALNKIVDVLTRHDGRIAALEASVGSLKAELNLRDLNAILADDGEPITCVEEAERVGIDLWADEPSRFCGDVPDEHDWRL